MTLVIRDALPDDAFETQTAGMFEDGGAVSGDCLAELDAIADRLVAAG